MSKRWIVALILLAVAIGLRARDFGNPTIHVDEQYYLLVGDRLLHGARLYVDIWDRKPLGLFLIFAAIRLLPGDGIISYQLVATMFAATTAYVISRAAERVGARRGSALLAGIAYLLWLSLLSGRGGQSPVFYNLLVASAALLTLRLPELEARRATGAIVANGTVACLLAGLAIQVKYTPFVEGAVFGLAHLWYLQRAGAGAPLLLFATLAWLAGGIGPTAAVMAFYASKGPQAFAAFWFANFTSVGLRRAYPAAKIAARLAGTSAQLFPLACCAAVAWRRLTFPWRWLLGGWLAAALVAFAMIGAFFDHYALPLLVPLCVLAAIAFDADRRAGIGTLALGSGLFAFHLIASQGGDARAIRDLAIVIQRSSGRECPYVFAGDAILYHLAHACLPTAYAFPSTLAYEPERGATGIDEAGEVRRIMARRPPAVVTMDRPLAPWNPDSEAVMVQTLGHDYRRRGEVARSEGRLVLFVRVDRWPPHGGGQQSNRLSSTRPR